ncbi:cytochrome c biogenesis protein CcdA [Nocardioides sp. TRM66260-LWL]|uniref:cytochrome c biogenesis CcdA family protein n=1 Tax=Nocardioides sp. TRM66260-LWL TaxID=2874478 RepID=UPI001CC7AE45|nr:cytochrome c biogenesis protein CcdA [Nocardioides sp. TRM66260-LWL]MBZ5736397.1 cytochrome c biogenesis protein CcdA [Nocardioides sp. TRM66260-LWL]
MIHAMSVGTTVAYGPLLAALPFAVLAGLVSFLSPCCLPLVPGYLAYVTGAAGADATGQASPARRSTAVVGTGLFVLGFAAVFTSYGLFFGALGSTLIRHQDVILRILGVLTVALGLSFAGVLATIPVLSGTFKMAYKPRVGLAGAPLLGVMFGVGWTPCIGPTLAAVLSLATTSGTAGRGAVLSFAYSLGLGIPFLLAALGISRVFRAFAFARRHALAVMRIGGGLLIVLGVLEVSGVWGAWLASLRTLIGTWQPPL